MKMKRRKKNQTLKKKQQIAGITIYLSVLTANVNGLNSQSNDIEM
jgi:hypothetical protein